MAEEITDADLTALQAGQPPVSPELLQVMTLGREIWLDRFAQECLQDFIGAGGSKVKLLLGTAGTGKTHLLRCALLEAQRLGFAAVWLSAREVRLHKLVEFYRAIAATLDGEALVRGLCRQIGKNLQYPEYEGNNLLFPQMCDKMDAVSARREIQQTIRDFVNALDVLPCFKAFVSGVLSYRMIHGREDRLALALQWLVGEKLTRAQARDLFLLTSLKAGNARSWLNSLLKLLVASGQKGLVVVLDNLEALTEKDPETRRYLYTPTAVQDVYEVIRQILDDAELMSHLGLLLAGDSRLLEDDKRGLRSYDALWLRLQSGIVPDARFNPLADLVDTDKHYAAVDRYLNGRFAEEVSKKLKEVFRESRVKISYKGLPDLEGQGNLRSAVMTVAWGGAS
jgi:hypothetical protein